MTTKSLDPNLLREQFGDCILTYSYPEPFPKNPIGTRAILLGCDPSNKRCLQFSHVFAIGSDDPDFQRFVIGWEKRLNAIGLEWQTIYAQNLCRNYFIQETSENKIWEYVAKKWIPLLKEELDQFDKKIPVLLTSEFLYHVLLNEKLELSRANDFYCNPPIASIPILPEANELGRPLIPFYRHFRYDICKDKNEPYRNSIRKIIGTI